MEIARFRSLAARMWDEIPDRFRMGVDALVVEEEALPHPDLPGIFTLGMCETEGWPSGYSAEGDVRSRVILYHGSFRALERRDPAFDWTAELWETILHELLHHREFAAAEAGLEAYDWAMDENFKRYADREFDPTFYRAVPADEDGAIRIESEIFLETTVDPGDSMAWFEWRGRRYSLRVPATEAPLFVNPDNLAGGRLWVVVWRERSWWRRLLEGGRRAPEHRRLRALPEPAA